MSKEAAKAFYTKQLGDPDSGYITPQDAMDSLDVVYADLTLADDTITAAQIAANAVGSSELADNAVDAAAIQSEAVTSEKIADSAVTASKLDPATTGVYNVKAFGAVGDGVTDDRIAVQNAATAAAGATLLFPAGVYALSDGVAISTGTTVIGHEATLLNTANPKPVFDIIMQDDITIDGLTFLTNKPHVYAGGTSVRLNDVYAMWAGILASGERLTVRNCKFTGFTCGISLHTWNGTDRTGICDRATVLNCEFYDNDFGILAETISNVTVQGVRGTYLKQAGISNPPHIVYFAKGHLQGPNRNVHISNVHSWNSDGHCVQIKNTVGGTLTDVHSDGCTGILSVRNVSMFSFRNLTATNDRTSDDGSFFLQEEGCQDLQIDNVSITVDHANAAASPRPYRIRGTRITLTNLVSYTDWPAQAAWSECYITGTDITLSGYRSINASTYGAVAIMVSGDSVRCSISDVTAINCRNGLYIYDGATGTFDVNLDKIVNGADISSKMQVYSDAPGVSATVTGTKRATGTVSFVGTAQLSGPGGPNGIDAPLGSTWRQTDTNAAHGNLIGLLWRKAAAGYAEGTSWLVDYEGRYISYPVEWTGTGGTPTIGDGVLTGRYTRRGKVVDYSIFLSLGSTSDHDSATDWKLSLPSTPAAETPAAVLLYDAGVRRYADATAMALLTSNVRVYYGSTYVGHSVPMAWTSGDQITVQGSYFNA